MAEPYVYPNQFEYEGIIYDDFFNKETLIKMATESWLDPSDVIIASYPKSGECYYNRQHPY